MVLIFFFFQAKDPSVNEPQIDRKPPIYKTESQGQTSEMI